MKMKMLFARACWVLWVTLCGCELTPAEADNRRVQVRMIGTVLAADAGKPVPDVTVGFGGACWMREFGSGQCVSAMETVTKSGLDGRFDGVALDAVQCARLPAAVTYHFHDEAAPHFLQIQRVFHVAAGLEVRCTDGIQEFTILVQDRR